ncbi:MAG TPA: TfoX/Sxy family protein [Gemmatimonadaceae bacterium]|nr:TfoX/Sxy family protein [Gemmatimonadaceae bacterium]
MTYDAGLVARIADLLTAAEIRTARQKNVFGGRGFLLGKSTFVIAWGDGLLVKTPPADYASALARPGVTPFAPDGESPMGSWVVVPPDLIADDPDLIEWLTLGARSIR